MMNASLQCRLMLLACAALPAAMLPVAARAAPVTAPGFVYVKSLGGIDEYRLESNGLSVLLAPEHSVPVVTFQVTYRVGSRNEVTGTTGATHILEHMMFKGSENYSDAKGNGPVAPALKVKVPDLAILARNNRGQFPSDRLRRIIMGDEVMASHGSRDMPVWGPIFHQIEADQDFGNVRLQNLIKYLESIQQN